GGVPGGGGCGTAASRPFGVNGVMVMKITSNTSRISMNGVTLISALAAIFFLPFFIVPCLLPADLVVQALGQHANLIYACVADIVHHLTHVAVFRAEIAFDENRLVQLGCQKIIDLRSKVVDIHLVLPEIELPVTRNGNENCIVAVGF